MCDLQVILLIRIKLNCHETRRRLKAFLRGMCWFKYLRIMLNSVGRLRGVSTINVQDRRRSDAHRLGILTLRKPILRLCNVKMDITYSKRSTKQWSIVRYNSDSFNRVCKCCSCSVLKLLQIYFVLNSFSQQVYSLKKSTSDYSQLLL